MQAYAILSAEQKKMNLQIALYCLEGIQGNDLSKKLLHMYFGKNRFY